MPFDSAPSRANPIPATEASVLSMTQPVFAAFLALGAGQQRPSWLLFFGVLFTFGGSIIMAKVLAMGRRAIRTPLSIICIDNR